MIDTLESFRALERLRGKGVDVYLIVPRTLPTHSTMYTRESSYTNVILSPEEPYTIEERNSDRGGASRGREAVSEGGRKGRNSPR